MDSEALVSAYVEPASRFVDLLDKAGLHVSAAFLCRLPEYSQWRLCLASSSLPVDDTRATYSKLLKVFRVHQGTLAPLGADNLTVVDPNGDLVRAQLNFTRTGPGIHRIYSFGKFVKGVALPDSIIFRLQPDEPSANSKHAGSAPA